MMSIIKKELNAYFKSPLAYVLIGLFIVLTSLFFFLQNLAYSNPDLSGIMGIMGVILLFIIPLLTMRILSEERKAGTEVLLFTSPTSLTQIILGKYLAAFFVFLVLTAVTLIYPIIILIFGGVITVQMVGGYIGFILLGAAYLSVGTLASALSESQVVAGVISFVVLFIMWISDGIASLVGGLLGKILLQFSLLSRYGDFNLGWFSVANIVFFITFTAVMIFLTYMVVERRRWSRG